jgi:hypothetical protein
MEDKGVYHTKWISVCCGPHWTEAPRVCIIYYVKLERGIKFDMRLLSPWVMKKNGEIKCDQLLPRREVSQRIVTYVNSLNSSVPLWSLKTMSKRPTNPLFKALSIFHSYFT